MAISPVLNSALPRLLSLAEPGKGGRHKTSFNESEVQLGFGPIVAKNA